jgi:hypothetical protein
MSEIPSLNTIRSYLVVASHQISSLRVTNTYSILYGHHSFPVVLSGRPILDEQSRVRIESYWVDS